MSINLSEAQFKQLLETIGSGKKGTMATCSTTYDGKKDRETVEAFLTALRIFKKIENISDSDAMAGLPLVLREEAAVWWQGTKNTITTWVAFENVLRSTFAPKKAEYLIYLEACGVKQTPEMSTDDFITKKRMLFSELPEDEQLSDKQQLDIIYGLLNLTLRDKVPREKVNNFEDLRRQARAVEVLQKEKAEEKEIDKKEHVNNSTSTPSITERAKKPPRCNFCKKLGHIMEDCRKRKRVFESNQEEDQTKAETIATSTIPKLACYGCGTPGVYRSNCKIYTSKPAEKISNKGSLGFCAMDVHMENYSRPMVFLKINGLEGKAYVDTCAKVSVASHQLYRLLHAKGHTFNEVKLTITLADGIAKKQNVLMFEATVELGGRNIRTNFIVLLESYENRTLLGIDFLQKAGIVLNIAQFTWHYIENPKQEFELYQEKFVEFNDKYDKSSTSDISTEKLGMAPINVERARKHPRESSEAVEKTSRTPTTYKLIPIDLQELPPKINCTEAKLLFDGYSPRMEFMMQDAIRNIEQAENTLPESLKKLFGSANKELDSVDPDEENGDDVVEICAIDVESALDTTQDQQLEELLREYEDVFQSVSVSRRGRSKKK